MSAPEDIRIVVAKWVERAEEDYLTASHLLELKESCPFNAIGFHAQQTVEKYIKTVLVSRSVDFPKIHDIGELVALLPPNISLSIEPGEQESLTRYAAVTRYPGNYNPPTRFDAERAVETARRVREAARKILPI
jgi:HEPN domain-containing protein